MNEGEQKCLYNKRVLEVGYASFIPLIFAIHGAMGIECRSFVSKFSELLAVKRELPRSTVTSWVRTKFSFAKIDVDMFTWFTFDQKQYNCNKRYCCARKPNQNQRGH